MLLNVPKKKRNAEELKTIEMHPPHPIWTETLLSNFGSKCIMSKHDSYNDGMCECLCHPHNQK